MLFYYCLDLLYCGKLHECLCSFPRIPIIQSSLQEHVLVSLEGSRRAQNPLSASEALWKDDKWCLHKRALTNATKILYTPFPAPNSVKHYQAFLKHWIS